MSELRASQGRVSSLLSWAVILLASLILMWGAEQQQAETAADQTGSSQSWTFLEIEAKFVLAQEAMVPGTGAQALETLERAGLTDPQRVLRLSTLAAVVVNTEAARDMLRMTNVFPVENTELEVLREDLDRLYAGDASQAMRSRIEEQMGWFGKLAVAGMKDPPERAEALSPFIKPAILLATTMMAVVGGIGLFGLAGLVGLVVLLVAAIKGSLTNHLKALQNESVYAETFAIWLIGFQVLMLLAALLGTSLSASWSMLPSLAAFLASLGVLLWPLMRGRSWHAVRTEIGWTCGNGVIRECLCGVAGYAMAIPIAAIGLLLTVFLIFVASSGDDGGSSVAHPIVGELADGGITLRIQILVLAVIIAPLVEETLFRGLLYRHLRSVTGRWALAWSVVLSSLVSGLIFAMIHPQGILAIPALTSLAIAFALAREWRGSLIAPMVMHGLSNGLIMTLLLVMVS
ncbi:MAG: CPBP family intramembrane metalloprotease [Phycisphaerales bacterium]|nr:CPBP family intramembrane metalloprotease [Phycisphaerales bacterium]